MARVTTTKHGVQVQGGSLRMGANLRVTFQRTLRIPDDGKRYPLPPGLGEFPLHRIEDYRSAVPDAWKDHGGVFMPLWQREALWLSFQGTRPAVAVKVGVGKVNALSGLPWDAALHAPRDGEQDYLVAPRQPWLDGINVGQGVIRQFVAMPLGMGYTVEGQVTGEERFGGIQLLAYDPKVPFPRSRCERWPRRRRSAWPRPARRSASGGTRPDARAPARRRRRGAEMGLAAGGRMEQKIYADEHGIETWDQDSGERVFVHIVNSEFYAEITGRPVPASPVDAHLYASYGYPWFELYDEHETDIAGSAVLAGVDSVATKDAQHGFTGQQDDTTLPIPGEHVIGLPVQPTWPKPATRGSPPDSVRMRTSAPRPSALHVVARALPTRAGACFGLSMRTLRS